MPAGKKRRLPSLPHSGHAALASSLMRCHTSYSWPHFSQRYPYVGTFVSGAPCVWVAGRGLLATVPRATGGSNVRCRSVVPGGSGADPGPAVELAGGDVAGGDAPGEL